MNRYLGALTLLLFSACAIAGDVTGRIQTVSAQTHPGWNEVMIQLEEGKIFDPDCGTGKWALIKVETELDKALVSIALTAKTTQELVRFFTSECSVPPATAGTVSIVEAIDFGIRY